MENKITNSELVELYPDAESFLQRISEFSTKEEILQQEELKFFSELLQIFSSEEFLPLEQLKSFPAKVILTYLRNSHRYYLSKRLPEIEQTLEQLSLQNLDIPQYINPFFAWMRQNMEKHFRIEEQSLFPYIESLELLQLKRNSVESLRTTFKEFTVKHFIESHDDEIENQLSEVKKQIVRSFSSVDELFPYRVLIHKLDLLEKELRLHARVEDEVLVPKALEWEGKLE
jgi:regulator of cell morphogenesis and NO signaling